MIAAASLAAALHGVDWTGKSGYGLAGLLDELTRITAIEQVCIFGNKKKEFLKILFQKYSLIYVVSIRIAGLSAAVPSTARGNGERDAE